MKGFLTILGPVIYCIGFIPYIKATVRKEIKPRIASWMTWSLILGITTIATLTEHAYVSAFLTGSAFSVVTIILLVALRNGDHDYNWVDGTSQTISLLGVVAWLTTNNALWAIIFNMVADFFGAVPTFYHGWVAPHEESWPPFIFSGIGATISVLALNAYDFAKAGFPIYLAIIGYALGLNIFVRQKMSKPRGD